MRGPNGEFSPSMSGPVVNTLPSETSSDQAITGHGPPEGVVPGIPGWTYQDIDTNLIYVKMLGTLNVGWKQVGAAPPISGGGGLSGAGSPQGIIVANPGSTYLDTSGNHFWVKATGAQTNTGWVELIQ